MGDGFVTVGAGVDTVVLTASVAKQYGSVGFSPKLGLSGSQYPRLVAYDLEMPL